MEHAMDEATEKLNPKPKKEKKAKTYLQSLVGKYVKISDNVAVEPKALKVKVKLVEIEPLGMLILEKEDGYRFGVGINMVGGIGEDKSGT